MNKGWILLLLVFLNGCVIEADKEMRVKECGQDRDCVSAGCSGQLCAPVEQALDIITTCEFKEEYKCLELTSCGCVNGGCAWLENEDYNACLEGVRA